MAEPFPNSSTAAAPLMDILVMPSAEGGRRREKTDWSSSKLAFLSRTMRRKWRELRGRVEKRNEFARQPLARRSCWGEEGDQVADFSFAVALSILAR